MNDTTIIKAELCDFLSARTKNLANIQNMEDREVYTSGENSNVAMPITKNDNNERRNNAQVVYPIISQGDVIGSVILMSKDHNTKMGETEFKLVQSAAGFLGSQMEI